MFSLVIFDCSPILGFSEAQILAARTDGLVLVVRQGGMSAQSILEAKNRITVTGGRILGVVMNRARNGSTDYGLYKYYKYPEYNSWSSHSKVGHQGPLT
jgi:Mrp family chromosome partitioning ATPase